MADSTVIERTSPVLTEEVLESLAEATGAHSISVMRRLLGLPVRGRRSRLIDREIVARGLNNLQAR